MRRVLGVTVLILAVGAAVWQAPLLQAAGNFLVISDTLRPADAIIAIGGDGRERIATAASLINGGYGRWLVISGGPYGEGLNSATAMRQQATAEGIGAERMLVDDRAESTYENAVGSARLMKSRGLHAAILLTSPYHTRRAATVFSGVFRPEGLQVRVLAVDDGHFTVDRWWTREFDRRLVIREYEKLLAFLGGFR